MPVLMLQISRISHSDEVIPSSIPMTQQNTQVLKDSYLPIQSPCDQWHCVAKCLNRDAFNGHGHNTEFKIRLSVQRMKSLIFVSLCPKSNHATKPIIMSMQI